MVVECSPGHVQGFTEFVDVVLLILVVQFLENFQPGAQWDNIDDAR